MKFIRSAVETAASSTCSHRRSRTCPFASQLRLRPMHRMLLVITTGLLCGALMVGTVMFLVAGPNRDVSELTEHTEVVENALTETHAALGKASSDFLQAFFTPASRSANALIRQGGTQQRTGDERVADLPGVDAEPPG